MATDTVFWVFLALVVLGNFGIGYAIARNVWRREKTFVVVLVFSLISGAILAGIMYYNLLVGLSVFVVLLLALSVFGFRKTEIEKKEEEAARKIAEKAKKRIKSFKKKKKPRYQRLLKRLDELAKKKKGVKIVEDVFAAIKEEDEVVLEKHARERVREFRRRKGRLPKTSEIETLAENIFRQVGEEKKPSKIETRAERLRKLREARKTKRGKRKVIEEEIEEEPKEEEKKPSELEEEEIPDLRKLLGMSEEEMEEAEEEEEENEIKPLKE